MKTYQKTKWVDNKTPVNAKNLNKIEDAISDLYNSMGNGNAVQSQTVKKLEWVTGTVEEPEDNVLYFILSEETGKLSSIQIGSNTIYTVE